MLVFPVVELELGSPPVGDSKENLYIRSQWRSIFNTGLNFLLSFSIGNSKFNPKGDMILFVVCGNLQVQEKLFKILILPKVAIQKLIQPYPAGSFLISWCHGTMCNSIFLIANIKHLQFPDYSFCCGCICRNN